MAAATRSADGWDWRQIADLGQQLRKQGSLEAQRDHILSVTSRYIDGEVELWLEEKVFRLPDWETGRIFPPKPSLPGMRQAIQTGDALSRKFKVKGNDNTFGWGYFAALPIIDSGICLGALP
ncbi:MAG: hypothetical protein FJZ87_08950, partial [Chloroflexi bacterium]|nr:hypothetical protein [Chloroflexota bacterium]